MDLMKKLGFRKADELDIHIANTAVRTSWILTMTVLLVWSIYKFIEGGSIPPAFIVLGLGLVVYFGTILVMREKYSDDHPE